MYDIGRPVWWPSRLARVAEPSAQPRTRRRAAVRAALVGYGLAGRVFHAPLIAATDGLELAYVVTGNADRAAQARADHPGVEVLASADDLFARPASYDVVVVAATNDVHAPLGADRGRRSARRVVVDKPLALTAADGARRWSAPPGQRVCR